MKLIKMIKSTFISTIGSISRKVRLVNQHSPIIITVRRKQDNQKQPQKIKKSVKFSFSLYAYAKKAIHRLDKQLYQGGVSFNFTI